MRLILQSRDLPALQRTAAGANAADTAVLQPLLPPAADGRGAAGRAQPGDRRADGVQGLPRRLAGAATAGLATSIRYFLKTFGRPERELTCECERTGEPSMAQVLHIANGDTINQKLSRRSNRIDQLLAEKATDEKIVEEAYLSALVPAADGRRK